MLLESGILDWVHSLTCLASGARVCGLKDCGLIKTFSCKTRQRQRKLAVSCVSFGDGVGEGWVQFPVSNNRGRSWWGPNWRSAWAEMDGTCQPHFLGACRIQGRGIVPGQPVIRYTYKALDKRDVCCWTIGCAGSCASRRPCGPSANPNPSLETKQPLNKSLRPVGHLPTYPSATAKKPASL